MRHDPASGAIVIMLRGLKMYVMAQAVADLMEQGSPAFESAVPILSQLLKAEVEEREVPPDRERPSPSVSGPGLGLSCRSSQSSTPALKRSLR
jgi:hypothetical protein